MDSIPMKERMKGSGREKNKVVVLCNTRDEERWRDEAGRVSGVGGGSEGSPQDSCTII